MTVCLQIYQLWVLLTLLHCNQKVTFQARSLARKHLASLRRPIELTVEHNNFLLKIENKNRDLKRITFPLCKQNFENKFKVISHCKRFCIYIVSISGSKSLIFVNGFFQRPEFQLSSDFS